MHICSKKYLVLYLDDAGLGPSAGHALWLCSLEIFAVLNLTPKCRVPESEVLGCRVPESVVLGCVVLGCRAPSTFLFLT